MQFEYILCIYLNKLHIQGLHAIFQIPFQQLSQNGNPRHLGAFSYRGIGRVWLLVDLRRIDHSKIFSFLIWWKWIYKSYLMTGFMQTFHHSIAKCKMASGKNWINR